MTYRSAEEALARLSRKTVDVILIDLRLPELDGMSLMKKLRADGVTRPMIMVTANVMGNAREQALAEGFDAFIAKPVLDIAAMIELIVRLSNQRDSATA